MVDGTKPPRKYEHIWQAILGGCIAACYDFQYYKKSQPPVDDPQVVYPPQFQGQPQDE